MKLLLFFIFLIVLIGIIYIYFDNKKETMELNVCPNPVYASDPDADVVQTLLINDFMDYMETRLQQVDADLDVINTLVAGSTFNIIIDPSNIADVSNNANLPPPVIKMDSTNPPNYGILFKLPKGRRGQKGKKGTDGLTGPTGSTGPKGPDGKPGTRMVLL
jgi:hypothetical protein